MPYSSGKPTWFRKGFEPGTIFTFDEPISSKWEIVKKLNESDDQLTEEQSRLGFSLSFATAKFLCTSLRDRTKSAFMRIYLQVPVEGTELDGAETRANQATAANPKELSTYLDITRLSSNTPKLLSYKSSTQDISGPVPGGYMVSLVWEMVPGLRLGNKQGPDAFWTLDDTERAQIRISFVNAFTEMRKIGYLPDTPALSSLVWHRDSNTLYFIGFRNSNTGHSKGPINAAKWQAHFGLAIPDSNAWLKKEWNQDTSSWKW